MTLLEFFLPQISNMIFPLKTAHVDIALCHHSIKVEAYLVDSVDFRAAFRSLGINLEGRLCADSSPTRWNFERQLTGSEHSGSDLL